MIDPFRYLEVENTTLEVLHDAVCERCLVNKNQRVHARTHCSECNRFHLLCHKCDRAVHEAYSRRSHKRKLVLMGAGYQKSTIHVGDQRHWPEVGDEVRVKYRVAVVKQGKVYSQVAPSQPLRFYAGCSGPSVHVQVLGCDNLHKSDLIGLSDPFCVVYWCGKKLGVTSTRYETLSPRWTAETFAIPAGDSIYHAQNEDEAQDQQALRIEVYDRDMFSKSDFLGQLRIHNTQLCELARTVGEETIKFPLSGRTSDCTLGVRFGKKSRKTAIIEVLEGNRLIKADPLGFNNPFVRVWVGSKYIGHTSTCTRTLDPRWKTGNAFQVPLHLLEADNAATDAELAGHISFQVINNDSWRAKRLSMGTARMPLAVVRRVLSSLVQPMNRVHDHTRRNLSSEPQEKLSMFSTSDQQMPVHTIHTGVDQTQAAAHSNRHLCDSSGLPYHLHTASPQTNTKNECSASGYCQDDHAPQSGLTVSQEQAEQGLYDEQCIDGHPAQRLQSEAEDRRGMIAQERDSIPRAQNHSMKGPNGKSARRRSVFLWRGRSFRKPSFFRNGRGSFVAAVTTRSPPANFSPKLIIDVKMDEENRALTSVVDGQLGYLLLRFLPSSRGQVIRGLDKAVQDMSLGEKAIVKLRHDYCYGSFVLGDSLPAEADFVFRLHLLRINRKSAVGVRWHASVSSILHLWALTSSTVKVRKNTGRAQTDSLMTLDEFFGSGVDSILKSMSLSAKTRNLGLLLRAASSRFSRLWSANSGIKVAADAEVQSEPEYRVEEEREETQETVADEQLQAKLGITDRAITAGARSLFCRTFPREAYR